MEINALFVALERILDQSRPAVLTTVDADGTPHSRWMVPTTLRGNRGALYAVTSPSFEKTRQIEAQARVSWLIQTKALDEIVQVSGKAVIIDNPMLKSDVLEALGPKLSTFWRVAPDDSELVVIETAIEKIKYDKPINGIHESAVVD
jgi:pyridoxamine 5'-phosphate oxidase